MKNLKTEGKKLMKKMKVTFIPQSQRKKRNKKEKKNKKKPTFSLDNIE